MTASVSSRSPESPVSSVRPRWFRRPAPYLLTGGADRASSLLRGLLPSDPDLLATVTFGGWQGSLGRPTFAVEVSVDAAGDLLVANTVAVEEAVDAILAGRTVVVHVSTAGLTGPATVRGWLFRSGSARAVDGEVLRDSFAVAGRSEPTAYGTRFETGWTVNGRASGLTPGHGRRSAG